MLKIAIFSEGSQYWNTFKPIIQSLIEKQQDFQYYTLDVADPALTIENFHMTSKFLGYGFLATYRFSRIEADVLLATTPNIGTKKYPLWRPDKVRKMIHVFHSINDISAYRKGSLDNYDEVIMVGDFQAASIREIEALRNLPKKKLISLGLPYLDELVKEANKANKERNKVNGKTILIGSSWGSKGCLQSYGTDFIKDIARSGYNVIVRPHPQSLKSEQHLIKRYKKELKNMGKIIWDEEISPSESMRVANLLVSDTSSIRFDFAFIYEKPVLTLDIKTEEMPGYERDDLKKNWTDTASMQIGYVIKRENIDDILSYINNAFDHYDAIKIRAFRDQTVHNFGCSGDAIAEYLSDKIRATN